MAELVVNGATCVCSFGNAPSSLLVLPTKMVNGQMLPLATIMDFAPIVNVLPFGMCSSPSNPTVAAATAAAAGVLTPMPCVPATVAPWAPGTPLVMIGKFPALGKDSVCQCAFGGTITVKVAGQVHVVAG